MMTIRDLQQRIRRTPGLAEGLAGLALALLLLLWLPATGALALGAVAAGLMILFRRIRRDLRSLRQRQARLEDETAAAQAALEDRFGQALSEEKHQRQAALDGEAQHRAAAITDHQTRHDQLAGLVTALGERLDRRGDTATALAGIHAALQAQQDQIDRAAAGMTPVYEALQSHQDQLDSASAAQARVYEALQGQQDQISRAAAGQSAIYETLQAQQGQIDRTLSQVRASLEDYENRLKATGAEARNALTQVRAADRDARVVHKTLRLLVTPEPAALAATDPDAFGPEMALPGVLGGLIAPRAVDVGANHGEFTASLRAAGFTADTIEPAPLLATYLRARFRDDPGVRVHEFAATGTDGTAELHTAAADSPETDATLFATLNPHPSYPGLHFGQPVTVAARRLDTVLAAEGPVHVGLLKTDTEGHDLEVLRGARAITADALLLEYWSRDFVFNGGTVKNTVEDYIANIDQTLYPHSVIMWRHAEEGRHGMIIDRPSTPANSWGNILFARERAVVEAIAAWAIQTYGADCLDHGPDRQEN